MEIQGGIPLRHAHGGERQEGFRKASLYLNFYNNLNQLYTYIHVNYNY